MFPRVMNYFRRMEFFHKNWKIFPGKTGRPSTGATRPLMVAHLIFNEWSKQPQFTKFRGNRDSMTVPKSGESSRA
ncbi:hypothetical protein CISG_04480 [Coccidioides immitis RMSCC 3703]|uniref:Uncharacterized protein n=1 Tax=Coccidioides immitis RMSCC 3703 TaxID=454286 RepID=A0A0J8TL51_COCIT|nr:hypothetical protein CISG_04480 [Coccidioides immitis RMSCC 3703]